MNDDAGSTKAGSRLGLIRRVLNPKRRRSPGRARRPSALRRPPRPGQENKHPKERGGGDPHENVSGEAEAWASGWQEGNESNAERTHGTPLPTRPEGAPAHLRPAGRKAPTGPIAGSYTRRGVQ